MANKKNMIFFLASTVLNCYEVACWETLNGQDISLTSKKIWLSQKNSGTFETTKLESLILQKLWNFGMRCMRHFCWQICLTWMKEIFLAYEVKLLNSEKIRRLRNSGRRSDPNIFVPGPEAKKIFPCCKDEYFWRGKKIWPSFFPSSFLPPPPASFFLSSFLPPLCVSRPLCLYYPLNSSSLLEFPGSGKKKKQTPLWQWKKKAHVL